MHLASVAFYAKGFRGDIMCRLACAVVWLTEADAQHMSGYRSEESCLAFSSYVPTGYALPVRSSDGYTFPFVRHASVCDYFVLLTKISSFHSRRAHDCHQSGFTRPHLRLDIAFEQPYRPVSSVLIVYLCLSIRLARLSVDRERPSLYNAVASFDP